MAGIQVFSSLAQAQHAGFEFYDRTAEGFIVRRRINDRWAMAVVVLGTA